MRGINILILFSCVISLRLEASPSLIVSLPLTGPAASYGQEQKNAIDFFIKRKLQDVNLLFVDDNCQAKIGIAALNQALLKVKADAIIGLPCSSVVFSLAPIAKREQLPIISLGAMASGLSDLPTVKYRIGIKDSLIAKTLLPVVDRKRLVSFVEETDFAESSYRNLKQISHFEELLSKQSLKSDNFDLSAMLIKASKVKPDYFLVFTQSAVSLANFIKVASSLNLDIPVVTGVFAESPLLKQLAPNPSMEILFTLAPNRRSCGAEKQFADFENEFGKLQSNDFSLLSAEIAAKLLLSGVTYEQKKKSLETICGPVGFDENGDLTGLNLVLSKIPKSR